MTRRQDAASVVLPGIAHALGALEHHHDGWEMSANERLVLLSVGAVETAQTWAGRSDNRTVLNTIRLRSITGLSWNDLAPALVGLLDRGLLVTRMHEDGFTEYRVPPRVHVPDRIGSPQWPDGTDGAGPWARV